MTSTESRRRVLATCAAAALVASGAVYAVAQAPSAFAATSANVWLTTPDRSNLLTQKASVPFGTPGSGAVITVDPNTTYQSMVGFGASLTDSAAWNIYNSPARNSIMTALFSPTSGAGLDWLRQPLGASDFSRNFYSYDDGSADPGLSRFSVSHDQSYILPLVTQAKQLNPATSVMVVPWSAPGWMKTNNNLVGGSLSTNYESTFADYLVKSVQAYQSAGVPVQYLAVQNEPQNQPGGYPGMLMDAAQQSRIINTLAPKLSAAGLGTKILAWDHNWNLPSYPEQVFAATGNNTVGSAWHCYLGDPSAQSAVHDQYPNKDIFFTECSGTESGNTFADSLLWQGRNLAVGATRNWARSVSLWNMALDNNHGPVIGSCGNCMGLVTVNGGSVTYNADYYVLGHLAKFVKPGAVRINSTAQNQGGIENVAFRNPDGSIALVAVNSGGTQNFQVSYGGQSFGYSMPAGSMATFTWNGSGGTTPPPTGPIDSSKWYSVTNQNSSKCLDDANRGTADGTALQQWTCTAATNQQWQFRSTGDGYYQVVNRNATNLSWDVAGGSSATADGAQVQLWSYVGGSNQQWQAVDQGGGSYRFVARNSNKCLDVRDQSTTDGALLQQWTCSGGPAQSFQLTAQ
ncbi:RICIN domain-containing protein [Kutzneria sp. 744]|uniref:RICIN domain-containing protein n=1 Tax=Kutzneria sp. (strain 744) TaxID=345341 RepID=UPI0003EEE207|nr:RICIN domain-containing protein [Kutzneria sp. 744]EWM18493.1 glucosylceramidase [Kutzneria sp. 744]